MTVSNAYDNQRSQYLAGEVIKMTDIKTFLSSMQDCTVTLDLWGFFQC